MGVLGRTRQKVPVILIASVFVASASYFIGEAFLPVDGVLRFAIEGFAFFRIILLGGLVQMVDWSEKEWVQRKRERYTRVDNAVKKSEKILIYFSKLGKRYLSRSKR